ncbi:hypothetical protein ACFQO7_32040 [Catellatospora aurea]|uniref:WD40 repeat protein n=1 Tax=Catellatospora aurea TaxID=1337874 RepID=A0ABW2H4I0_9ACTN
MLLGLSQAALSPASGAAGGGVSTAAVEDEFAVVSVVDEAAIVGDPSIVKGSDGLALITYRDGNDKRLKVAHCSNATCSSYTTSAVPYSNLDTGLLSSAVVGSDAKAAIVYVSQRRRTGSTWSEWVYTNDVMFAHCADVTCATMDQVRSIESFTRVMGKPSIAIGPDGLPLIAYVDYERTGPNTSSVVKVTHCVDVKCESYLSRTVYTGRTANWVSIAVGPDGIPVVLYATIDADNIGRRLKLARCADAECAVVGSQEQIAITGGAHSGTVAFDPSGNPAILAQLSSDNDPQLRLFRCSSRPCTGGPGSFTVVDFDGSQHGLAFGTDGNAIIAYRDDRWNDMRIVHCKVSACADNATGRSRTTVEEFDSVEQNVSITIGGDGLPIAVFKSGGTNDLKVVHCADKACLNAVATPF